MDLTENGSSLTSGERQIPLVLSSFVLPLSDCGFQWLRTQLAPTCVGIPI